ncbi:MAG TPA: monofunctional biosynthetic peptidoglycan transglycosylase [Syntrophales bacterium]|nr:monofunctional biosynthetic peptidoglycan transglycosylase [Syntrophales bacterium]HOX93185.1 monofunctional biosynthetic peptidoglycan transglycosylase [Syntrophales bacterium]HPI57637.1 monofunctional biosynthetic peptidoglycan transglycosylase [Syntrophales bacterium]HPN25350.1 monofunctional biosynthetic peptidoglycan transglycosylase [Syntrophales bacterium]HQM29642.1 monofunctional biosynthetic peptidoglycan transglycosylase [Syntrophales bacterium]
MAKKIQFKKMIKFGAIALPALLLFVAGLSLVYPDVSKLKKENPRKTAFMEYREKEWRQQGKKRRIVHTWVPFSAISPYAVKAVIIAEDDKFWSHEGFDYEAMQKALEKDLKKKKFKAGGSTISQQLAKNLYLSPSKNPIRKLREAVLTWRIENALTKRRILELYLNVVEWGDGVFGVEAAARHHFGKSAADLSPREAARLATVLPNPRRYRPTGTSRYVENQSERIYSIMVQRGIVIPEFEDAMTPDESSPEADQKKNSLVGP